MTTTSRPTLLVAIGDSDVHDAALAHAASEAVLDHLALRLVHVVNPRGGGGMPQSILVSTQAAHLVADGLVEAAAHRAGLLTRGTVPIETVTPTGDTVSTLAELAECCERVVLQHRQQSRLRRVFTGSVASGLAAVSPVPVVSVPEYWPQTPSHPHLTVGVDPDTVDSGLLDTAFALASRRQGSLTVMHGWHVPSAYDDAMVDLDAVREWTQHTSDALDERLAPWRARHPEVDVRVDVAHMRPADLLVEATRHSDLLLLSRGSSGNRHHLGALVRSVVREALCPVEIVPPTGRDAEPWSQGKLEDARLVSG